MNANTELDAIKMQNTSLKGLISDYALRAKQSEQMTQALLHDKFDKDQLLEVMTKMLTTHSNDRTKERLVHHQALMQATLIALSGFVKPDDDSEIIQVNKRQLIKIIESLRLSL